MVCRSCGRENDVDARFCAACGEQFDRGRRDTESRKVVTVVFTDVVGSTALGERLDPESLRRVMGRYFGAMQATLERHGGTVEKFIGDAIVAVFGVPVVHEDDALRAVRAALEMQEALGRVNDELAEEYGVRLATRTGVNTGEVVVGDAAAAQRLATGDAVNVAARLEQAASAGEVLVGEATYRLVGHAVVAHPAPAVDAKGKSQPVAAWRVVEVRPDVPALARRLATPVRRTRRRDRRGPPRVRHLGARSVVPARHDHRTARDRQVAPGARSRPLARTRGAGRRRSLSCVRRGDHVPAARRDRARGRRSRPRVGADGDPGERRARARSRRG